MDAIQYFKLVANQLNVTVTNARYKNDKDKIYIIVYDPPHGEVFSKLKNNLYELYGISRDDLYNIATHICPDIPSRYIYETFSPELPDKKSLTEFWRMVLKVLYERCGKDDFIGRL